MQILPFWQDEESALSQLVVALNSHFPKAQMDSGDFSRHLDEFEEQKRRVETAIRRNRGKV